MSQKKSAKSYFNTIVAIASVSLIVLLVVANYFSISTTGKHLHEQATLMLDLVEQENWSELDRVNGETKEYWREHRVYWLLFVPRSSIDTIEMEQARLKQLIIAEDKPNAMAVLGAIHEELEQVIGLVEFNWVNVL